MGLSPFFVMYRMALQYSFQYPTAKNSDTAATEGAIMGNIMDRKIRGFEAPSTFADSSKAGGVPSKAVLIMSIL